MKPLVAMILWVALGCSASARCPGFERVFAQSEYVLVGRVSDYQIQPFPLNIGDGWLARGQPDGSDVGLLTLQVLEALQGDTKAEVTMIVPPNTRQLSRRAPRFALGEELLVAAEVRGREWTDWTWDDGKVVDLAVVANHCGHFAITASDRNVAFVKDALSQLPRAHQDLGCWIRQSRGLAVESLRVPCP